MGTRFTTNDPDRESKMTIESNRRQVLKGAGGALTAAGVMGQAGGRESADRVDISEKTDVDDRDADLLPNTWMHSVGTTPFRGAHGHRNWSPYPIARRAENLNEVGFNAIGLIADDIAHILEFETGFANKSTTGGLNELNDLLKENNLDFVELEFLTEWVLPEDDYRREAERETRELLLEAADILEANHIKIGNINGYPASMEDIQDRFADISAEFAEVDTEVGLEFFPVDPNVQSIHEALEATSETDNGGLYLDLWHNIKLDVDFDNIASLSGDDIVAVEFNDGYIETELSFLEETINLRKVPGEGEFPISDWVSAVREGGFDGPWGLEILSEEFRRLEMVDAYPLAYNAGARYV
jgi:sugar phosphate isomerase/epimerase